MSHHFRRTTLIAGAFALAALLCAPGCGNPSFDGTVYRGDGMAFRIGPVPDGWRRIEVTDALLAFRDDGARATIAVNGRCGEDGDDVPLVSLTQHLFLQFTEREIVEQQTLDMDGREALRTQIVAKLDGVPKRFTVYVLKKDGCVYDFLHIADHDSPADSEARFARFVESFATESPS